MQDLLKNTEVLLDVLRTEKKGMDSFRSELSEMLTSTEPILKELMVALDAFSDPETALSAVEPSALASLVKTAGAVDRALHVLQARVSASTAANDAKFNESAKLLDQRSSKEPNEQLFGRMSILAHDRDAVEKARKQLDDALTLVKKELALAQAHIKQTDDETARDLPKKSQLLHDVESAEVCLNFLSKELEATEHFKGELQGALAGAEAALQLLQSKVPALVVANSESARNQLAAELAKAESSLRGLLGKVRVSDVEHVRSHATVTTLRRLLGRARHLTLDLLKGAYTPGAVSSPEARLEALLAEASEPLPASAATPTPVGLSSALEDREKAISALEDAKETKVAGGKSVSSQDMSALRTLSNLSKAKPSSPSRMGMRSLHEANTNINAVDKPLAFASDKQFADLRALEEDTAALEHILAVVREQKGNPRVSDVLCTESSHNTNRFGAQVAAGTGDHSLGPRQPDRRGGEQAFNYLFVPMRAHMQPQFPRIPRLFVFTRCKERIYQCIFLYREQAIGRGCAPDEQRPVQNTNHKRRRRRQRRVGPLAAAASGYRQHGAQRRVARLPAVTQRRVPRR